MLQLKFVFSFSIFIIFIRAGLIQHKLSDGVEVHIDRLDTRCSSKNVPYRILFQGVKTISTNLFIRNLTALVREGGFKRLLLTIVIERCRSKENLDTCEEYLRQSNIDYCKVWNSDIFILNRSPLYISFVPPLRCPIKKGTYHSYNLTMDLTPFMIFELGGWYWKVKYEVVSADQNKLALCVNLEGYVTNSKFKSN